MVHVPHDIIRALGVSPEYEDGRSWSLASADQFGVGILRSTDHGGDLFLNPMGGTGRLAPFATGTTFSPNFKHDGIIYLVTDRGYYKSNDRGINWERQPHLRNQAILCIWLDNDYSTTQDAYILTRIGLYLSKGNGASLQTLKKFFVSRDNRTTLRPFEFPLCAYRLLRQTPIREWAGSY